MDDVHVMNIEQAPPFDATWDKIYSLAGFMMAEWKEANTQFQLNQWARNIVRPCLIDI